MKNVFFQVYIADLDFDPGLCFRRNVHGRSEADINLMFSLWEKTPKEMNKLDLKTYFQEKDIDHVEMDLCDDDTQSDTAIKAASNDKQPKETTTSTMSEMVRIYCEM